MYCSFTKTIKPSLAAGALMNKIFALIACLVLVPLMACAEDSSPNILLIIADQHTGSVMTQRGYSHITTPGIDKIADSGVTFTRAYTPYPVCKAYRKSMMTGLMPSKIADATEHPSIGNTLRESGYETVYHGKWHVGETRISRVEDWHGFETYDGRQNDTTTRERVVDFIRQEHDRPFFLVTAFMNPHDACELARNMSGVEDDYKDEPIDVSNVPLEDTPPLPANFAIPSNEAEGFALRRNPERGTSMFGKHPTKDWGELEWRRYMYGYDRLLEMVDAHIKLVIDELEAQGLLDNTVIIYTSDHGDGHASHQWNQKMTFYEEAINVRRRTDSRLPARSRPDAASARRFFRGSSRKKLRGLGDQPGPVQRPHGCHQRLQVRSLRRRREPRATV
jgi:arylsulfatase A-like enzyme